jgi:hypothetical protein
MAKNRLMANAAVNAEADAMAGLLSNGYLRIYDGAQPATADTPIVAQVLLAELRFGTPAFGSAALGVITATAITKDSAADHDGTATWFRCLQSDGITPVFDDTVGLADSGIILDSVDIAAGAEVSVTSFTHTVTKG